MTTHQQQALAVLLAFGCIAQQLLQNSQQSPSLVTSAALDDRKESCFIT
jgi:hypothetical protein